MKQGISEASGISICGLRVFSQVHYSTLKPYSVFLGSSMTIKYSDKYQVSEGKGECFYMASCV